MENRLKELRKKAKMTQEEAAKFLNISRRTYQNYEKDVKKKNTVLYEMFIKKIEELIFIDEENGLLSIDEIKECANEIFKKYEVRTCYLFGSYAKGYAKSNSDVDLLIDASVDGLAFFGLVEELRSALRKKVDLIKLENCNDTKILGEILKDGIKIYG